MSRRSTSHAVATWICLAACVLIALLPAGGLAVCLGAEGHFDVGAAAPDGVARGNRFLINPYGLHWSEMRPHHLKN